MNELNINQLEKGFKNIRIGELDKEIINLLGLQLNPCPIIMWEDRWIGYNK